MREEGAIGEIAAGLDAWRAGEDTPSARAFSEFLSLGILSLVQFVDAHRKG